MIYGQVPEQFSEVSLSDRSTWHRATLREWLELRSHLLEKQTQQKSLRHLDLPMIEAMFEANRRLGEEMKVRSDRPQSPRGNDAEKRRAELMDELFYQKHPEYDPLTKWEERFLKETQCLDRICERYHKDFYRSDLGLLFHWITWVEGELDVAGERRRRRIRYEQCVAQSSERRMKSNRNPFYPRPLELIRIFHAVLILVENMARDFEIFVSYGDPVPGTEDPHDFGVREYLGSGTWRDRVVQFVNELRRLGYLPYRDEQHLLSWEGWKSTFDIPVRETSRNLVAHVFAVSGSTIKKDTSEGRLRTLYDRYAVTEDWREFSGRGFIPDSVTVLRSGWQDRVRDGAPNRFDVGTSYMRLPRY